MQVPLPGVGRQKGAVELERVGEVAGERRRLHLLVVGALGDQRELDTRLRVKPLEPLGLRAQDPTLGLLTGVRPDPQERRALGAGPVIVAVATRTRGRRAEQRERHQEAR